MTAINSSPLTAESCLARLKLKPTVLVLITTAAVAPPITTSSLNIPCVFGSSTNPGTKSVTGKPGGNPQRMVRLMKPATTAAESGWPLSLR